MQKSSNKDLGFIEIHAIFSGQVQGVGFRATVNQLAHNLNLLGTVKNLPNGSVELFAQGSNNNIIKLLEAIHRKFGIENQLRIDQKQVTPRMDYEGFRIIY